MKTDVVIVVDPFSSGRYLAAELKKHSNLEVVAVISSNQLADFYYATFQLSDFKDVIQFVGGDEFWIKLEKYNVKAVLPGSEPGVILAHRIAEHYGLERNSDHETLARRNKYLMIERIRNYGLPSLKQVSVKDINEAREIIHEQFQYPVVIKPLDSAGSEGVFICRDDKELEVHLSELIGLLSVTGTRVDEVLIQELAVGTEYVVDTVRADGNTVLTGLWKYRKIQRNNSSFVYDTMSLVANISEDESALIEYTLSCLDALGVKVGPNHSEVMQTSAGPRLIETGSRIHGGNGTLISGKCLGYNQIDLSVSVFTDKSKFRAIQGGDYCPKDVAQEIFLISEVDGIFRGLADINRIRSLKTFDFMTWNIAAGSRIVKTVDLLSSPGRVVLIGSPDEIASDYAVIREWELGAYEIA